MKKTGSTLLLVAFFVSLFSAASMFAQQKMSKASVEVYYFHFTRRCVTCQAVETETQKAIATLYPTPYKAGKIVFKSINLDEASSKQLAEKCQAEGQALLVISGSKRIDLTDTGFMYAKSKPEKLKAELKKVLDSLIRQ